MTEGAPADFAGHADVVARWRPFRNEEEQAKAVVRLGDASALLRTLVTDIDERIAADDAKAVAEGTAADGHGNLFRVARAKVADSVVRYLDNPRGAKQLQQTIGPRSLGLTLPDGGTLGIFFTEEELKALQPTAATEGSAAIGTTFVGIRPGWGPSEPPRSGWWPTS